MNNEFNPPETVVDLENVIRGYQVKTISIHEAAMWAGLGFRFNEFKTIRQSQKIFYIQFIMLLSHNEDAQHKFNYERYKVAHEFLWLLQTNLKRQMRQERKAGRRGVRSNRFCCLASIREYDEQGVLL